MGLYPSTINDGTADHTIALRGSLPNANSIVTEYFEPGAASNLVLRSSYLIPKGNSKVNKCSSKLIKDAAVSADENKPITCTVTLFYDKRHAEADVEAVVKAHLSALSATSVPLNFVRRLP